MFIHTFELSRFIDYKDYLDLKSELPNANSRGGKKEKYLVYDSSYNNEGIAIALRQTSEKEWKYPGAKENILILYVNVSKLQVTGDERNYIECAEEFIDALNILKQKISIIFLETCMAGISLNDFWVSRADITKDVTLPEEKIPFLLSCIRRLDLKYGFMLNEALEENTQGFDSKRSVNIVSKSRGYEFVFYDKGKSLLGKDYATEELVEYFRNVLRIELRCRRKYISKITEGSTFETILQLYSLRNTIFYKEYKSLFATSTSEPFVSLVIARREIDYKYWSKEKKRKQARALVEFLAKNEDSLPSEACLHLFNKESTEKTVLRHLQETGISPITIYRNEEGIVFISALDEIVELGKEEKYV